VKIGTAMLMAATSSIHLLPDGPLRACLSGPVADPYLIPQ